LGLPDGTAQIDVDEFFAATGMDANDMGGWRIRSSDMDRPACCQHGLGGGSVLVADIAQEGRFEILCRVRLCWHDFLHFSGHPNFFLDYNSTGCACMRQSDRQGSYTANGLNQLTQVGSGAASAPLGYDGRGNLTSSAVGSYTYTSQNRLFQAPGGVELRGDALDRLGYISTSGTQFAHDGADVMTESTFTGATGPILRRYVRGAVTLSRKNVSGLSGGFCR
jgi:hypothetical protein